MQGPGLIRKTNICVPDENVQIGYLIELQKSRFKLIQQNSMKRVSLFIRRFFSTNLAPRFTKCCNMPQSDNLPRIKTLASANISCVYKMFSKKNNELYFLYIEGAFLW